MCLGDTLRNLKEMRDAVCDCPLSPTAHSSGVQRCRLRSCQRSSGVQMCRLLRSCQLGLPTVYDPSQRGREGHRTLPRVPSCSLPPAPATLPQLHGGLWAQGGTREYGPGKTMDFYVTVGQTSLLLSNDFLVQPHSCS